MIFQAENLLHLDGHVIFALKNSYNRYYMMILSKIMKKLHVGSFRRIGLRLKISLREPKKTMTAVCWDQITNFENIWSFLNVSIAIIRLTDRGTSLEIRGQGQENDTGLKGRDQGHEGEILLGEKSQRKILYPLEEYTLQARD